ncbi:MAG: hypothetical protein CME61_08560 [Halobacteriovoraceae bacterium]|nr:hypothetical protein [Halobacteriovoraceae bacterium]
MSGRSLFGANQTGQPYGTNPANARSVFESNHPRTGINRMTISVEDLRLTVPGQGFFWSAAGFVATEIGCS